MQASEGKKKEGDKTPTGKKAVDKVFLVRRQLEALMERTTNAVDVKVPPSSPSYGLMLERRRKIVVIQKECNELFTHPIDEADVDAIEEKMAEWRRFLESYSN